MSSNLHIGLANFIASEILKQPNRQIDPNEPLISSGLVDSFSLVDLSLYIQDTYRVTIDDTELNAETFDTISQLCLLVESRMK